MEVYGLLAAGIYNWPLIKQISWLLGQVMNGIYNVMSAIGIHNIGICIIIFTIIVYMILFPLTIKQQRFSKMSAIMQPEIQKIQKKYANKRDQVSMQKQQEEMNMVYEKYGVKMSSGCLPSFAQILILFGLYPVVQNIPRYVTKVREVYMPLVDQIQSIPGSQKIMETIGKESPVLMNPGTYDYSNANTLAEALYKFQESTWNTLIDQIPQVENLAKTTMSHIGDLNNFLGIDIGSHPWDLLTHAISNASILGIILAVIIPILAGITQFISVKLAQMGTSSSALQDSDNPMARSMKSMTYTMPLISVFFGFTLPAGLGLYWIASAVVRSIQQVVVNNYLKRKTVEDIIAENQKKLQKKREKKGTSAKEINKMATTKTRNVGITSKTENKHVDEEKERQVQKAHDMGTNARPGSLTYKANLVNRYNSGLQTDIPVPEEDKKEEKGRFFKKKKK